MVEAVGKVGVAAKSDAAERLKVSYGAWLGIFKYLAAWEGHLLQGLSRYFYLTGIPRV